MGAAAVYVRTDCMDEDAIARAIQTAAGLGPLRAAVITHIGPDWPRGRGRSSSRQRPCILVLVETDRRV